MIKNLTGNPHLSGLYLQNCSIPEEVSAQVLVPLSKCRNLFQLCYGGNVVGSAGSHLEDIIHNNLMERLILSDCKMPRQICESLLNSLGQCGRLRVVNLTGNEINGALCNFLSDADSALPYLTQLHVGFTELASHDVTRITTLVQNHKLPELGGVEDFNGLWLQGNNFSNVLDELDSLFEVCLKEYKRELKIGLWNSNLGDHFEKKWTEKCKDSKMKLLFRQPSDYHDDYFLPHVYPS